MGLFDHFPYTNVHELNLDWILTMMKALKAEWEAFTAGNSLTFADPLQHRVSKTYAKNTIVLDDNGNAYVSLKAVPVGIGLQNEDYWLMVFDYEAFIEKVNKNFTARYYRGNYRATAAMVTGDWLTVDDVLCKATAAIAYDDILEIGVNIEHFTLEDFIKAFMQSANQLIQQYKNDIDASEVLYRAQLAQDIANITASLQAQLDLAISGVTADSEIINARIGWDNDTYSTLGDAIRTQVTNLEKISRVIADGYNITDGARMLCTNRQAGLSGTNIINQTDSHKCSFGAGLYFVNRDFVFRNRSVELGSPHKIEFVIVTFDQNKNIINNTGWVYSESYLIEKGSCSFFLIQIRYDDYPNTIMNPSDVADYIELYVSKESCDKNSPIPLAFMLGYMDPDGLTVQYRDYTLVPAFAYHDFNFINMSESYDCNKVWVLSDNTGTIILNTGYTNYPHVVFPIRGYYGMLQLAMRGYAVPDTDDITDMLNGMKLYPAIADDSNTTMKADAAFKVISHRCENITAPENTIWALRMGYMHGFRIFESDVQLTSDDIPVLCHDATIDRVSDGSGTLSSMSYSDLLNYDFGSWKGTLYSGTKILTLEEAIIFCKDHNCHLNLELKSNIAWDTTKFHIVYDMIAKYNMLDHVSWNNNYATGLSILQMQLTVDPTLTVLYIPSGWTTADADDAATLLTGRNKVYLHKNWSPMDSSPVMSYAISLGLLLSTDLISTYDLTTQAYYESMLSQCVSSIITEQPSYKVWSEMIDELY